MTLRVIEWWKNSDERNPNVVKKQVKLDEILGIFIAALKENNEEDFYFLASKKTVFIKIERMVEVLDWSIENEEKISEMVKEEASRRVDTINNIVQEQNDAVEWILIKYNSDRWRDIVDDMKKRIWQVWWKLKWGYRGRSSEIEKRSQERIQAFNEIKQLFHRKDIKLKEALLDIFNKWRLKWFKYTDVVFE